MVGSFVAAALAWVALLAIGGPRPTVHAVAWCLATAAVLVSLYPGMTVLLARVLLHEKFSPVQRAGLSLCTLAVVAIDRN